MNKMSPTYVLIDTDADFDDYMALSFLISHHNTEVKGITVTGVGAAHLTRGAKNINDFLTIFNDPNALSIPIAAGHQSPMIYSNTFPYDVRLNADEHYQTPFSQTPFSGENPNDILSDAEAFIIETLTNAPHSFTVLMIGGGTTWGNLFAKARTDAHLSELLNDKVDRIVMMGGNLLEEIYPENPAKGNIQDTLGDAPYYSNQVAEWNIFVDPLGSQMVFDSGIPIDLIALNATQKVPITQNFVDRLNEIDNNISNFLFGVLESDSVKEGIGSYLDFWDPLAAIALVYPDIVKRQPFRLAVEQRLNEEDDQSGKLIPTNSANEITVAIDVYPAFVTEIFLLTIAGDSLAISDEITQFPHDLLTNSAA